MDLNFDINSLKTPCYVVDEANLQHNLAILKRVATSTGCKILLAQKAFSMYSLYPLISEYLQGTTASGLYEAKLGYEKMGGENHIYSPAYLEDEFDEIAEICDHIVFNSFSQWEKFKDTAQKAGCYCGIRINPECSTQQHPKYDPCAPGSRLGVPASGIKGDLPEGITGLHFHTLCEQNADALVITLSAVEEKFGEYLKKIRWLNMGGGHHITRDDYDSDTLISEINRIQETYGLTVYLEPGEAVALNAGYLIATVKDILDLDVKIAILDTSATCHMPDVLEVPYRPFVLVSGLPHEKRHTYRLGGISCLAGDVIGDYSFDEPLKEGDRIVFEDMAHYTMVKNNTFNGIGLPSIAIAKKDGGIELVKSFGYEDFKNRLS